MAPMSSMVGSRVAPTSVTSVFTIPVLEISQIQKASKALLSHLIKATDQQPQLLPDRKEDLFADDDRPHLSDIPIWLTVTAKRHLADSERLKPSRINLPHPLNSDDSLTICLITADPQRTYKDLVASADFSVPLRKRITRVISFSKLRAKYSQYEAQRKLLAHHDIFLCDDRIINRLPKVLGKTFYKSTTKRPVPISLGVREAHVKSHAKSQKSVVPDAAKHATAAAIATEIEQAVGAATVNLKPSTQVAIRIGCASWPADRIAANIEASAKVFVDRFIPEKWRNVKNISIKGSHTAALPIWMTDELWLHEGDVLAESDAIVNADGVEPGQAAEKSDGNRKRKLKHDSKRQDAKRPKKSTALESGPNSAAALPPTRVNPALPDFKDDLLDKEIAIHQEKLRKQKSKAKLATSD